MEKNANTLSGFLLIDKPTDWTSHDVVGYLRKITKIKTIGHAGTLDPFATGLLIVGVGRAATKRLDEFKDMKKTYYASAQLGAVSDTYDRTGKIQKLTQPMAGPPWAEINKEQVEQILNSFIGTQEQLPPMYSAKKIQGKKLYELARQGIEVERKTHRITIFSLKLIEVHDSKIEIEVECSAGTYIRTLVHDIGQKLGGGAYCENLRRTKIGEYNVKDAIDVRNFSSEDWSSFLIDKAG